MDNIIFDIEVLNLYNSANTDRRNKQKLDMQLNSLW